MIEKIKRTIMPSLVLWMLVSLACNLPVSWIPDGPNQETQIGNDSAVIAQVSYDLLADTHTTLGNLAADHAEVDIPQNTFDSDTSLSMAYLSEPPVDSAGEVTPLGPIVALSVEGEQTRFNEPVTITLKFDSEAVNGPGDVYAAYYHEAHGWHYFVPDEVDVDEGEMHFKTYHFSWWSAAKPTDEEIIDKFVTKQTTEQFVRQTQQELANEQVEKMVQQIMEEGMGVYDNKTIEIITKAVLKEAPFGLGKIGIAIYDNKPDEVMSVTLEETAKALGKALKDGTVADIAGEAGTVGAFSGAAGAYAEGDYEGAMEIMADEILNNIPLVSTVKKTGEAAVAVMDHWIQDQWKKPGMDKAYEVYATGVDKYGYRAVDAGDFNEVVNQMGGLARQVRIDYVDSYCTQQGCDPSQLTDSETLAIGDRGMELLQQQWEARYERQEEIEQIKENNMALMEMFKEKGLLEMVPGRNPMYSGHEDLEMMMNRLNQMTQKILRDTGRTEFVTHSYEQDPDNPKSQLWGQDVADLVWIWYVNQPDSKEAYQQALIDMGLLVAAEDEALIYGVKPQQVVCEGSVLMYGKSCSVANPIKFEFWNIGALGGEDYNEVKAIYTSGVIGMNCEREEEYEETSLGSFSGGPNGTILMEGLSLQLINGENIKYYYGDGDSLECSVVNPEAFDGWTGP